MFSIKSQHQSSFLTNKKNQIRKEIRREQLDAIFASKRKELFQKNHSQAQQQTYLKNFSHILNQFFNSDSDIQAETTIKTIFDELTRDNVKFQSALLQQPQKLIKMFILFPKNRHAIQIFRMVIEYCYDQTFGVDDHKFTLQHNENSFEVKIEHKQMTEYQEAIDVLLKTIHELIPELKNCRPIQYLSSLKEIEEAHQINKRIQKKLKMYLSCFANISIKINAFIMRYEYVEKYLSIWSKWLILDYDFCKGQILRYINLVVRFVIPYQSLSKLSNNYTSQQQIEAQETIVLRLFELCVPQGNRESVDNDKYDILAIFIIQPLFSYAELKINVVVKFIDQIMRLLRVVLWRRDRFKLQIVLKLFKLITNIINRLIHEANNEHITEEDKHLINSINIIKMFNDMELLQSMKFYLISENWAFKSIFQMLHALIEYCIVFDIQIGEVIGHKELFMEICHKISYEDRKIMETNLKSLGMICRYAEVKGINSIFAQMINNGVPETLQNLAYSLLDEFSGQEARELLEIYFSEQQVKDYTRIEEEREDERLEVEMPQRHEYYDN